MTSECRIGSLPWFAGLWWLGVGMVFHRAAWGALWAWDGCTVLCLKLNTLASGCFMRAIVCAREGGASDVLD